VSSETSKPITRGEEPRLAVRPRPAPFFLRRRFLLPFTPVAFLAVVGFVALLVSANLLLPFERLVTFEGAMGSKADFFDDEQVQELLLRHHMRVHVTRQGSREVATGDLASLDFVFPSGQPSAQLVIQRRRVAKQYYSAHRTFVSPIVLATYRGYAETLRDAGVATPQATPGFDRPYYYGLDLHRFLDQVHAQKSWEDLNIRAHGVTNGNKVLAQTTDVCRSDGAATYLGLVSYLTGEVPTTDKDAIDLAIKIKPMLRSQGLPEVWPELYFGPEGRQTAPIIVIYEHQYLAYQLRHRERSGELDGDRVLLYPSTVFQTQPEFIALNDKADQLGVLLKTDRDLHRRALELGFRVIDPTSSEQLSGILHERRVPEPSTASSTRAILPDVPLLEKMISVVGDCP
jgi:hypothetical protein